MTENKDIRWMQRFDNYRKALRLLGQAVEIVSQRVNEDEAVEDLLKEGLIQRFEYTHELAWKVMKRWMESIADRNLTSHNYDDETLKTLCSTITNVYFLLFVQFEKFMSELLNNA